MPTFDVVSEVDMQEVRNAVDQAQRELSTRFDFKGTDSTVELNEHDIEMHEGSAHAGMSAVINLVGWK